MHEINIKTGSVWEPKRSQGATVKVIQVWDAHRGPTLGKVTYESARFRKGTRTSALDVFLQVYQPQGFVADDLKFAQRLLTNSRKRAVKRSIDFKLTLLDVERLLKRAAGRCEVTHVDLDECRGDYLKRPFAASIDRVSSAKGYTMGNCRIVCVAANFAMNEWGESALYRMLEAMQARKTNVSCSESSSEKSRRE